MKLAVVAQRYGQSINGGAELHARYIAEHLARHADVEVLTTCATDYVTWKNELRPGTERVNDVAVRRFRVRHERKPLTFGHRSQHVFNQPHSLNDELRWLDAEGPASPALIRYIARSREAYDFFVFFSYRYYHAYHGARAAASRAVLVPTAERDEAIGLSLFKPVLRGVRALMYNSPEERALIHGVAANAQVPSVVVGVGSEVPTDSQPSRFRQKYDIKGPFAIYVGRIDENKGCKELFEFFSSYLRQDGRLSLVLIGNSLLPIPRHPRITHLGFLNDRDKFDAMAAAEVLLMPSYFESLSMVALEAWGLGRPVIANAKCDVLKGQCIRSNAGLYYQSEAEFVGALRAVEEYRWLSNALGRNGRQFFRAHYEWPIIERKYLDMFARLSQEPPSGGMAPLPGWFERRRPECPAASEVLAKLPRGAAPGFERAAYSPVQTPLPVQTQPSSDTRHEPPARQATAGGRTPDATARTPRPGPPERRVPVNDRRRHNRRGRPERPRTR